MTAWQPIETASKDGPPVILWAEGSLPFIGWFVQDRGWRVAGFTRGTYQGSMGGAGVPPQPTHWQPLPEPPDLADGAR